MSYTSPAGNAAHFNFEGPYLSSPGNRADLTWVPLIAGAKRPQSFSTTSFGTPVWPNTATAINSTTFGASTLRITQPATGEAPSTSFGTPNLTFLTIQGVTTPSTTFGTAKLTLSAVGFSATLFGTPNAPYLQTTQATGEAATTAFGTGRLTSRHVAFAALPSTVIPQAFFASNQTLVATGSTDTHFGSPLRVIPADITSHQLTVAWGWRAAAFGTPNAPSTQLCAASGFSSTQLGWPRGTVVGAFATLGTPTLRITQAATGSVTTAFGTAALALRTLGAAPSTAFGTPTMTGAHLAATVLRRARFGTPAGFLMGHKAYGFNRVQFGRATGFVRINHPATGWAGTTFGTPASTARNHALHIPPTAAFGTPLLTRTPLC